MVRPTDHYLDESRVASILAGVQARRIVHGDRRFVAASGCIAERGGVRPYRVEAVLQGIGTGGGPHLRLTWVPTVGGIPDVSRGGYRARIRCVLLVSLHHPN